MVRVKINNFNFNHLGRPKIYCMQYKIKHKYTTAVTEQNQVHLQEKKSRQLKCYQNAPKAPYVCFVINANLPSTTNIAKILKYWNKPKQGLYFSSIFLLHFKYRRSGVPAQSLLSRRIPKLCNLSRVKAR